MGSDPVLTSLVKLSFAHLRGDAEANLTFIGRDKLTKLRETLKSTRRYTHSTKKMFVQPATEVCKMIKDINLCKCLSKNPSA